MLSRLRPKPSERPDAGFTLIELLVVMIIIGILAAIAIPVFLNQRTNGYRSAVKSDLKNAATAVESYAVDNNGNYTALNGQDLLAAGSPVEFTSSNGVASIAVDSATGTEFCIEATHSNLAGETWRYQKSVGVPEEAACP